MILSSSNASAFQRPAGLDRNVAETNRNANPWPVNGKKIDNGREILCARTVDIFVTAGWNEGARGGGGENDM